MYSTKLGAAAGAAVAILVSTSGAWAHCPDNWSSTVATCANHSAYVGQGGAPTGPAGSGWTVLDHDRSPEVVPWGNTTIRYVKGTSREAGKQLFYYQN